MAELRGTLRVAANESRVNAVLQAICGDPVDPIAAGTNFLAGLGFVDGDQLVVSGNPSAIGNVPVFCVQSAIRSAADAVAVDAVTGMREIVRRRPAPPRAKAARPKRKGTSRKKDAKKAARRKTARKGVKTAARKSAEKRGARKSTKTGRKGR